MKSLLKTLGLLVVIGLIAFFFRDKISASLSVLRADYLPCRAPIAYTLGDIDSRFNISKEDFLSNLKQAETIWENGIEKDLFVYSDDGNLIVNLVYDYRQQTTDKLQTLGIVVKDNQNSYNELKTKHDALESEYLEAKIYYESRLATFEANKKAYEQEVDYWNDRGGAPKAEYSKLQQKQANLKNEASELNRLQVHLNETIDQLNALVVALNEQAKTFNITASEYNTIGVSRGEEFQEGLYVRSGFNQRIDIYEFSDEDKLIRVLAHEFGHALGLGHVDDVEAIMYKLNQGGNLELTKADIEALYSHCKI